MEHELPKLSLAEGLQIWAEQRVQAELKHLGDEQINQLASPGALASCSEAILDHLGSCPPCLARLKTACEERDSHEAHFEDEAADDWYSGGTLEAAATEEKDPSLRLPSNCGNFILKILSEKGQEKRGMVVLELQGEFASRFESSEIQVRDNSGSLLLEGTVIGGRLARLVENVESYSMQSWSLVVKF